MIEIKKGWVIKESAHVVQFLEYILSLDIIFHPDDDMLSYINLDTDEPTFSINDAKYLNGTIDKCFAICGDDVYDICMELMQKRCSTHSHETKNANVVVARNINIVVLRNNS